MTQEQKDVLTQGVQDWDQKLDQILETRTQEIEDKMAAGGKKKWAYVLVIWILNI